MQSNSPTKMTTKQVAALKGVTVKTVNLWAREGRLAVSETDPIVGARFFDPSVVALFDPKSTPSPDAASPKESPASGGGAFSQ